MNPIPILDKRELLKFSYGSYSKHFGPDLKCDNCGMRLMTVEKTGRCLECISKIGEPVKIKAKRRKNVGK